MNKLKRKILPAAVLTFFIFSAALAIETYPRNIFIEHFNVIPPLGAVKSIATSTMQLFVVSDNDLLIIDKIGFSLERTVSFNEDIDLIAYDHLYDEIWLSGTNKIIRYNINLGSIREYPITVRLKGIGINQHHIYLESNRKFTLDRVTGEQKEVSSTPEQTKVYRKTSEADILNHKFLSPYYYLDDLQESQVPFSRYAITAVYDDGMYLYVGTDRYGVLKYNKLTWNKERIVYGPLDRKINKARKINNRVYFVSSSGVSILGSESGVNWQYRRLALSVNDIIPLDTTLVVSQQTTLSSLSGSMVFPISTMDNAIITLGFDNTAIYAGTDDGMFRIARGTREPYPFGPDKYPVHVIFPTDSGLFVGGDAGFYYYSKYSGKWQIVMKRGIKDIARLRSEYYLLTIDNQLIRFSPEPNDTSGAHDTSWVFLPCFNVYDIDNDSSVVYCATFAGINYYDPSTNSYNAVSNLPRIKYDYVFAGEEELFAVSDQGIFRLSLKYRD